MDARLDAAGPAGENRASAAKAVARGGTVFAVLFMTSGAHALNDLMQSLLAAIYPLLRGAFHLDYGQIGLITLTFQCTASLLQPLVGLSTDRKPRPYSLPLGMVVTLVGLVLLATARQFEMLLLAAGCVGIGSSIFHPEASRVARMASGGRHGLAQSLFQVGGNFGTALGPLLAAYIVVPHGQGSIGWFTLVAVAGIILLTRISKWYARALQAPRPVATPRVGGKPLSHRKIVGTMSLLLGLIFSKHLYLAGMSTFYTFFLIHKFGVSIQTSQLMLFLFLGAVAAGTIIGGPVGDRVGRRSVIWVSILGVLPFTLLLPYADFTWTCVLSVLIGLILSSAFSAIVVFAQELIPGKVGLVSGLFFGFAFGIAGLGAAVLGTVADATSIDFVFKICAFLPALGVLAFLLPKIEGNAAG